MWESLSQTFDSSFWEQPAARWLLALGILLATMAVMAVAKRVLVSRLRRLSRHSMIAALGIVAAMLEQTKGLFYMAAGLHLAALVVELPDHVARGLEVAVIIAVFFQIGLWAAEGVTRGIERYRNGHDEDPSRSMALSAIRFMARFLVWVGVVLLVLGNLGFDVTALVASLGIGGVAVALAVQNILGDLFASLSILVDKPFVIGDFIIVGDYMGSVEKVGLKTTRVRSLSGEQIIFSNTDLLKSRVRNYKRMEERRVVFEFGVVYRTETEQIEQIPQMVREIIEEVDQTRFDRAHFKAFGDSAFRFEVVYYVLSADFNVYMDIHQEIILTLLRRFREEDIQFAYPTRTVHLEGQPDKTATATTAAASA